MKLAEFKQTMCTYRGEFEKQFKDAPVSANFFDTADDDLTKRNLRKKGDDREPVDWRPNFSAVRDQLRCGSCWAFSTTGAIEGNLGVKNNVKGFPWLSPQQFVDCDTLDKGCNGGSFIGSFKYYLAKNKLELDADYPYTGVQGTCSLDSNKATYGITSYQYCTYINYLKFCSDDIVYGYLSKGPVSVTISAGTDDFQHYKSVVYTHDCTQEYADHAVILVGYGTDETAGDYWIVRNSWNDSWGEAGYIRVAVNAANNDSCLLTQQAYLPVV